MANPPSLSDGLWLPLSLLEHSLLCHSHAPDLLTCHPLILLFARGSCSNFSLPGERAPANLCVLELLPQTLHSWSEQHLTQVFMGQHLHRPPAPQHCSCSQGLASTTEPQKGSGRREPPPAPSPAMAGTPSLPQAAQALFNPASGTARHPGQPQLLGAKEITKEKKK